MSLIEYFMLLIKKLEDITKEYTSIEWILLKKRKDWWFYPWLYKIK